MNYYARHIGDYLKDTAHLSLLEHGIYGRLLDTYYSRESGLPDDQIARLVGARTDDERTALQTVLKEFFDLSAEGTWTHGRCEREIAKYQEKSRKASASADARWAHTERIADAMRTHTEGNAPNSQEPIAKKEREPRASRLADSWVLPEGWKRWAKEERPDLDPDQTAARFSDHWRAKPGKDGRKLDWEATWRNWVRGERAPIRGSPALTAVTVPSKAVEETARLLAADAEHRKAVEAERLRRKQA